MLGDRFSSQVGSPGMRLGKSCGMLDEALGGTAPGRRVRWNPERAMVVVNSAFLGLALRLFVDFVDLVSLFGFGAVAVLFDTLAGLTGLGGVHADGPAADAGQHVLRRFKVDQQRLDAGGGQQGVDYHGFRFIFGFKYGDQLGIGGHVLLSSANAAYRDTVTPFEEIAAIDTSPHFTTDDTDCTDSH